MAEVISSHNKTYLLVYHEIIFKVLSFHRLSAWVKHQIVDVNIQGVSYAKNSVEFPIPTELSMNSKFNSSLWKFFPIL